MTEIASRLLEEHETPLYIAIALIRGRLSTEEQMVVHEVVTPLILEAAKIRLQLRAYESHIEASNKLLKDSIKNEHAGS